MATTAQNRVTFGLSEGHYALATPQADGSYTFGTVKSLPNLQSMEASVLGGKTDVYADNVIVATMTSYPGQELTVNVSELSDDFKKDVLGYLEDSDGNLCEVSNAQIKSFAFGCQIEGDVRARKVWYFLCSATNPGEGSNSKNDSPEANQLTLTFTVRPITVGEHQVIKRVCEADKTNYATFFSAVTLPTFGA